MRTKIWAGTALLAAGVAIGSAGAAHAEGSKGLIVTSVKANTVVLTFTNSATEATSCGVYASGPVTFDTPVVRIPPRGATTVTVADVPAGFYNIGWGCQGFGQEKHYLTVAGVAKPSAQPHVVSNGGTSDVGALNQMLSTFGS